MKLKKLIWHDEQPNFYGKVNRSGAVDDVWIKGRERIYIGYWVCMAASGDDKFFININWGHGIDSTREEVDSFEEGKTICEHYRKEFWNKFYNEMMNEIFENT